MTQLARQWQQGAAGEFLTRSWCSACQEVEFHTLGLVWWKPGRCAQGDLRCPCGEVRLLEAYVHPPDLPARNQFFLVHSGHRDQPDASGYTIMVVAATLAGAHHIERIYSDHYVPFHFTGDLFPGNLLP